MARRAGVGIARGGGGVGFFSGGTAPNSQLLITPPLTRFTDIFLAFSTAAQLTRPQPPKYEQRLEPVSTYVRLPSPFSSLLFNPINHHSDSYPALID